jgi:hypothetical protein
VHACIQLKFQVPFHGFPVDFIGGGKFCRQGWKYPAPLHLFHIFYSAWIVLRVDDISGRGIKKPGHLAGSLMVLLFQELLLRNSD